MKAYLMLLKTMKMNFEPHMIHETLRTDRTDCVIQGKDPQTAESNIKEALDKNPDLDYNDLKLKAEKDVGLYITWVTENNKIKNIEYPRDWCAGATAILPRRSANGSGLKTRAPGAWPGPGAACPHARNNAANDPVSGELQKIERTSRPQVNRRHCAPGTRWGCLHQMLRPAGSKNKSCLTG